MSVIQLRGHALTYLAGGPAVWNYPVNPRPLLMGATR